MITDLEADLRREFDAARPPNTLTFSPDSVLHQGSRSIRRRRILAAGSTAIAVGLVVVGSTLMNRPHDSAAPQPATQTATTDTLLGTVRLRHGTFALHLQTKVGVAPSARYFVITPAGGRLDLTGLSTAEPGQKPVAIWGSGIVDDHPVTIGLVPSTARDVRITFTDGTSYGRELGQVEGAGYSMFAVDYASSGTGRKAARPSMIQSIDWYGDTGIVDGVGRGHRLTGRVLTINSSLSVEVVVQPLDDGRTVVFGRLLVRDETLPPADGNFPWDLSAYDLNTAATDSAPAVVTGRQPLLRKTNVVFLTKDGPPIAAGILPPSASDIGVELTSGARASRLAVQQRLPDGRVIFAMSAGFAHPTDPGRDSIKAITWTNADGTQGRFPLT